MCSSYEYDCTPFLSYLSVPFSGVSSLNIKTSRQKTSGSLLRSSLLSIKTVSSNERALGCRRVSDVNIRARIASPRHHGPAPRKQWFIPTAVGRVRHRAETDAAVFERKVNSGSGGVFDHNAGIDWSADCDDKQRVSLQGATRER